MRNIVPYITNKLFLKVNLEKSTVAHVSKVKYLGYGFYRHKGKCRLRVHPKSVNKMKNKIREMTVRGNKYSNEERKRKLTEYVRGWVNYFRLADMKYLLQRTDEGMRRRIRAVIWKQWKRVRTRYRMLRKLHVKTLENNDLLTLANQARNFKKLFAVFTTLSAVPLLVLVVGFLLSKVGHNMDFVSFLLAFCATLVFFVSVGIAEIRHKTKPCDEIIRQIEASEATENKKTVSDKKQKWFFIAMMVTFLCLDVWAYMIVASRLILPPMWRTVEYVRAADDHLTEGKLAIWEVFADTVVPEKDVPELRQILNNDSYILMEGRQEARSVRWLWKASRWFKGWV